MTLTPRSRPGMSPGPTPTTRPAPPLRRATTGISTMMLRATNSIATRNSVATTGRQHGDAGEHDDAGEQGGRRGPAQPSRVAVRGKPARPAVDVAGRVRAARRQDGVDLGAEGLCRARHKCYKEIADSEVLVE